MCGYVRRRGICANVLIVHPANRTNSVAELVAYAKANPGKVAFASAGRQFIRRIWGISEGGNREVGEGR
jgi:tripartite-type tricarboxylate transporter receptor subunit TctC